MAWWIPAAAFGALWWWALLRLTLAPDSGALEGTIAAGGWGLSLLPVHCAPYTRRGGRLARLRARLTGLYGHREGGVHRW